ncbi:hypothetical protein PYW08_005404 [Mythimna loreyi]|uniref:Uncharacterized protein n=1 Tax=Mythimna loreyi TaxID=667449 RepID=A0ACC2QKJ4_9NEOP|nr:hypothetical protein PYW08_005404 [Mythimna loreyi]
MSNMNKSFSDGNITETGIDVTPPNYISQRIKRMREEDLPAEFCKFKEEMKELFTSFITNQQTELKNITANLKEINVTNSSIEASITSLMNQNEELKNKIMQLELQSKKDKDYIIVLEDKIEDLQRCSRKNYIEIKNVPKKSQETRQDLINMVLSLARNIDLELNKRDIKDIFRTQNKKKELNSPPIIVELDSFILKQDLLRGTKTFNIKNKFKLQTKHLGFTVNEEVPVFISEQLTPKNARLFFLARDLAKSKHYKFCWTASGRVFVKRDENAKVIPVRSESQVHSLLLQA